MRPHSPISFGVLTLALVATTLAAAPAKADVQASSPAAAASPTATALAVDPTKTPYTFPKTLVPVKGVGVDNAAGAGGKLANLPTPIPTVAPVLNPTILAQPSHPERLPGQHSLEFSPDYYTTSSIHPTACPYDAPPISTVGPLAGWSQERCAVPSSTPLGANQTEEFDAWVFQAGAHFDLSQLDQIPAKSVTSARLTFDEARFRWTDADGNNRDVRGCVSTVGLPTTDWQAIGPTGLIPNITVLDFSPWPSDRQDFSGTEFDVTGPVQSMQLVHGDQRLAVMARDMPPVFPNSFVLRGSNEDLHGGEQSSCLSAVSNVRLHVNFVVPDGQ